MKWLLALLLITACTQLPAQPAKNPAGNDSILTLLAGTGSLSLTEAFPSVLLVEWIQGDASNTSNISNISNASGSAANATEEMLSGNSVEFYISSAGLERQKMFDGQKKKFGETTLEVSFIGESSGGNIVIFKANNESTDTLREKESDSLGPGRFIYVMDINYR